MILTTKNQNKAKQTERNEPKKQIETQRCMHLLTQEYHIKLGVWGSWERVEGEGRGGKWSREKYIAQ